MATQTRWPHLMGEDGHKAVKILKSESMEPRLFKPGMTGLSQADGQNPKFLIVNVDHDNKVIHLTK